MRSTTRPLLFLFTLLFLGGCASESAEEMSAGESTEIPALNPRTEGLDVGDFKKISERYEASVAALQENPEDVEAYVQIAQVFAYEARVTGDHPYYYPAAEKMIDRAIAIDPDHYEATFTKAALLLSLHRFDDALAAAEKAVALAPNAAAPYGALVDAHVELGNIEEAVRAADRMMEIRPDLKSYARVSYLRELHGDMKGAIETMRLAVNAGAPGSEEKAWARKTLGDILYSQNRLDDAEAEYLMTIAERDRYPFALAALAQVMAERGNNDSALALLDEAIALVPEFSFVQMKADIHRLAGRDDRADSLVKVVTSMLAEDEASGHSMNLEMVRLYATHETNLDEALRRAQEEVKKRPDNAESLDLLALVLMKKGEHRKAVERSRQAVALAPENGTILAHAGLIEIAAGNRSEGIASLRKARKIRPRTTLLLDRWIDRELPS